MKLFIVLISALLVCCFSIQAQNPIISSFQPSATTICGGNNGDEITINGAFFQARGSNSDVSIGGRSCTIVNWTNTQITCTAASYISSYSGFVIITNQAGNSSSGTIFKIVNETPQNLISFTASIFTLTQCGDSALLISGGTNGNTVFYAGFCGGTELATGVVFKVAPTNTTTYFAANKSFTSGCLSDCRQLTINANLNCVGPTISSIPLNACTGASVEIDGSGFIGVNSVLFNGVPAVFFTVNSANTITVTIPNGATTGNVTVNTASGTALSAGSITLIQGPSISINPVSPTVCRGSSVSLTASGADSYIWSPASDLSSSVGATVSANPDLTRTYSVTGTTGNCNVVDTVTVIVNQPPLVEISPNDQVELCGISQTLTATEGLSNYVWSDQSNGQTLTATQPGMYAVNAQDQNGCIGFSDTVEVIEGQLPIASFTYVNTSGFTFQFSNTSQHATTYLWDFGAGSSAEANPDFTFPGAGTFPVKLIVTNGCGNDTILVELFTTTVGFAESKSEQLLIFPNPVKDNMHLRISGFNEQVVRLNLYNQLGQLVYSQLLRLNNDLEKPINLSFLKSGFYNLQITGSTNSICRGIVKE